MQTIRVQTTQNVHIHYALASVGDRIIATILDALVIIVYALAMGALLISMEATGAWIYITLLGLPYLFYHLIFEILMGGQTPGKAAMKIKVVRLDGTPPTVGNYILRWIFRIVDTMAMGAVAIICIAAGGKGQRLGDMVAGTSVVKLTEEKQVSAREVFVSSPDDYTPVFPEAANLTSKDIELIQQALEVNRNFGNQKPAELLRAKIIDHLQIRSDMPPIKFLYTVVKDYNHLTSIES